MNNKLKVGLLVDSLEVPYWVYLMIDKIKQSEYSDISLIISNNTPIVKNNILKKIKNNRDYFLYKIYTRVENIICKQNPNAFEIRNLKKLLGEVKEIKVTPKLTKYSDWIKNEDVDRILEYDLDVIIRLGFRILRGRILDAAKCGIWSLHHGDNDINRGGPAGFWEVFEQHPVTGSVLQILNEDLDGGKILTKSYSTTDTTFVKRNCNNYYMKTISFIPRKLKELHDLGKDIFLEKVNIENNTLNFYSNPLYSKPKNLEFLKLEYSNWIRYLRRKIENKYSFEQWSLLFNIQNEISKSLWKYKIIHPPKDRFWADPHVIVRDNNYFIFIEEYIYQKDKGHVALLTMDKDGNYKYVGNILERKYHLSYPFVFEFDNNFYMIPETESNKSIEIYKCIEFPEKWEYFGKLMSSINAVDSTLFQYNNKWWMFSGIKENNGASNSDELFLFHSDNPLSDKWEPHPENPIISDSRKARPGGKIFSYRNSFYRPSQDCSNYYGYGISINQIKKLNEDKYEEIQVSSILPKWTNKITRVHTFTYDSGLSIIDAKIKRSRL